MKQSSANKSVAKKRRFYGNGAFLGVTVTAVFITLILIALGRMSISLTSPVDTISTPVVINTPEPTSTPPITPSPVETTVTPAPTESLSIDDFSKGLLTAPVTIIAYTDYQCSRCQQFTLTVEKQLEEAYIDTGKVLMIHKFVAGYGEESRLANIAAACAAEQGQFWAYHYLLMQQRASPSEDDLSIEKLQGLAEQLGLDMNKFNDSLLSEKYASYVDADDAYARGNLGINQVPMFFINGIQQPGAAKIEDLQSIIDPILENEAP